MSSFVTPRLKNDSRVILEINQLQSNCLFDGRNVLQDIIWIIFHIFKVKRSIVIQKIRQHFRVGDYHNVFDLTLIYFNVDSILSEARICQGRISSNPPSDSGNIRDKAWSPDDWTGKTNRRKMFITFIIQNYEFEIHKTSEDKFHKRIVSLDPLAIIKTKNVFLWIKKFKVRC